jgi:hypothetical protein
MKNYILNFFDRIHWIKLKTRWFTKLTLTTNKFFKKYNNHFIENRRQNIISDILLSLNIFHFEKIKFLFKKLSSEKFYILVPIGPVPISPVPTDFRVPGKCRDREIPGFPGTGTGIVNA